MKMPGALPDQIPDCQLAGQSRNGPPAFGLQEFGLNCPGDTLGDLILDCEDLGQLAIEPFGPDVSARAGINEL